MPCAIRRPEPEARAGRLYLRSGPGAARHLRGQASLRHHPGRSLRRGEVGGPRPDAPEDAD